MRKCHRDSKHFGSAKKFAEGGMPDGSSTDEPQAVSMQGGAIRGGTMPGGWSWERRVGTVSRPQIKLDRPNNPNMYPVNATFNPTAQNPRPTQLPVMPAMQDNQVQSAKCGKLIKSSIKHHRNPSR